MKKYSSLIPVLIPVLVIALILTGCSKKTSGSQGTSAALPEVINIGTQQMPNDENIAKAKNFFESLGVKVNLLEFDSGAAAVNALASNSLDLGLMGSTPATTAISSGLSVELIWIHGILGKSEALAVKNGSGINSVKDLSGAKVGVPFGSTGHYSLLSALELNNVDVGSVTILDLQPADIYAAWQRGDISAAYVWDPTLGNILKDGKVILTSEDLAKQGAITADVEIVRKEFGAKYPQLVAEYIKVLSRAQDLYRNDFNEASSTLASYFNISLEDSIQQIQGNVWLTAREQLGSQYLGTTGSPGALAEALKKTADFLVRQQSIREAPTLSAFQTAVNPKYIELSLK